MHRAEIRQQFAGAFSALDLRAQEVFLVKVGYWLSFVARETYQGGIDKVDAPERLRSFNEALYRVFDHLQHLTNREGRYPDDVFANILIDNVEMVGLNPEKLLRMLPASST